jgi:hypothetical protein
MQVFRLKPYVRAMTAMGFDEAAMQAVEAMIVAAPDAHPMIKGLRGARKARFARPGTGQSGGGRTIYYIAVSAERLFMMTAYAKNERDDISAEQRKAILRVIEGIKGGKR